MLLGRALDQLRRAVCSGQVNGHGGDVAMCSISRDPRWEECTICTAVAPEDVFTVRRYGDTTPQYGLA
jgi:hypothetical protein